MLDSFRIAAWSLCLCATVLTGSPGAHAQAAGPERQAYLITSRNPPLVSHSAAPALVGLAVLSGAVGISGLIFTNYRLRHRPHSARLRELSTQNQSVRRQLKQVRRDLKREGWSLAPHLPVLSAGFGLQASCAF